MKRILLLLLCGLAAVLTSCKEDTPETNRWFETPQTRVDGTTVEVSCRVLFDQALLSPDGAGFAYAPLGQLIGDYTLVTEVRVSGDELSCRIEGLAPQTSYAVYAFAQVNGTRRQSKPIGFLTGDPVAPDPDAPTFGAPAFADLTASAATVCCSFSYSGEGTVSEAYFLVELPASGEQREDVSIAPGEKSVKLSGLTAATEYTFRLCVVIDGRSYSSAAQSFTTLAGGSGGDAAKYSGWAELPAETSSNPDDYYYAYHMRADARSIRNYSICYSAQMRCAVWVAYPLHESYNGSAGRNDSWKYDPSIPSVVQPALTDGSYDQTPKPSYSRGHMIASSDRQVSRETNKQTFYVTNMAPQLQNRFNSSIWNTLENQCWNNVSSDTLFVVTGAHFANSDKTVNDKAGNPCVIPTHFYKVMIRSKSGNTGKPLWELPADQIQCVGFWFEHKEYSGGTPAQYMTSVAEIEQKTGERFFVNVPHAPNGAVNKSHWRF